jgi:hypothetical protein
MGLEEALVQEWQDPRDDRREPLIIKDSPGNKDHIFVIWSKWKDINMEDRCSTIMSAYKRVVENKADLLKVTLVMGLTPEEAPRFGIEPQAFF